MRKRCLFLLLCAFLAQLSSSDYAVDNDGSRLDTVQLSSSEYAVDNDGSRLDTVQPDLSTAGVAYGDKRVNGSEFASGMAKIRRARSVEEELAKAENDLQKAGDELKKAKELDGAAQKELDNINNELGEAIKDWGKLNASLEDARTKSKTNLADEFALLDLYEKNNITAFTNASNELTRLTIERDRLKGVSDAKSTEYENMKESITKATNKVSSASSEAKAATQRWLSAEEELEPLNTQLTKKKGLLEENNKKLQDFNTKIEVHKEYQKILADKNSEISKKPGLTNSIVPINAAKAPLVLKKTAMEENDVFEGKFTAIDWKTMTVDEAIAEKKNIAEELKEKYEKLRSSGERSKEFLAAEMEKRSVESIVNQLEEIKSFNFSQTTVQEIINNRDKLIKEVADKITAEDTKISGINEQIAEIDKTIGILDGKIAALATNAKKTIEEIEEDYAYAEIRIQDLKDKIEKDGNEIKKEENNFSNEKNITATLKLDSSAKNETLKLAQEALEKATNDEFRKARDGFTEADNAYTKYLNETYEPAETLKSNAETAMEEAKKQKSNMASDYGEASRRLQLEESSQEAARKAVEEKQELQRKAESKKSETKEAVVAATTKYNNANTMVKELKLKTNKSDVKVEDGSKSGETDKISDTVSDFATGLGTTVGILIIVARVCLLQA